MTLPGDVLAAVGESVHAELLAEAVAQLRAAGISDPCVAVCLYHYESDPFRPTLAWCTAERRQELLSLEDPFAIWNPTEWSEELLDVSTASSEDAAERLEEAVTEVEDRSPDDLDDILDALEERSHDFVRSLARALDGEDLGIDRTPDFVVYAYPITMMDPEVVREQAKPEAKELLEAAGLFD